MRALSILLLLCGLLLLPFVSVGPAVAQENTGSGSLTQSLEMAEREPPGFWSQIIAWVFEKQRSFHRELTQRLRGLSREESLLAAWSLILASFLYGVFHAAGPGHGKAVMTGYLLTHRSRLAWGLFLASAAAFCQGLVALAIVYGLVVLAGWIPRETQEAVSWAERMSFFLVAMVGAYLIWRAGRLLLSLRRQSAGGPAPTEADTCCGHSHGPTLGQFQGAKDLRTAAGIVLSIGLRPCSGAIIILVFAEVVNLRWAGIAAVLAMSAGTALTVSSLAALAVTLRDWGGRYITLNGRGPAIGASVVALLGGLFVFWVGATLLASSFGTSQQFVL
jgi:ABC-type nickel/cobalt efflux system permease component RcnA